MRHLPDVNLLVALAWPAHEHHEAAKRWFEEVGCYSWATCPITRLGFVRACSNSKLVDGAVSPTEAHALLMEATGVGDHEFWTEGIDTVTEQFVLESLEGPEAVTDSYLLALARDFGGKIATFDKRLAEHSEFGDAVELVSAA